MGGTPQTNILTIRDVYAVKKALAYTLEIERREDGDLAYFLALGGGRKICVPNSCR